MRVLTVFAAAVATVIALVAVLSTPSMAQDSDSDGPSGFYCKKADWGQVSFYFNGSRTQYKWTTPYWIYLFGKAYHTWRAGDEPFNYDPSDGNLSEKYGLFQTVGLRYYSHPNVIEFQKSFFESGEKQYTNVSHKEDASSCNF